MIKNDVKERPSKKPAKSNTGGQLVIDKDALKKLLLNLAHNGFELIGPILKDGTICFDRIESGDDMPVGITDQQQPGQYQTKSAGEDKKEAMFEYTVGPHSPKRFVFPPRQKLWQITNINGERQITEQPIPKTKFAFIGIRPCDLAALSITDRVFKTDQFTDALYKGGRANNFILAVNCVRPGETCFCASVGAGPQAEKGFDLCLTEVCNDKEHFFLIQSGSKLGKKMLGELNCKPASASKIKQAEKLLKAASSSMGRNLDTKNLKETIYDGARAIYWDEVGKKCLSCTNCTMVCPTCFCSSVEDATDLVGSEATRTRIWDSCFNEDYSYLHGGSVRSSSKARYRHWMTHKLAAWQDQFGTIGCVGCGRCITWCPVGIDITEEAASLTKRVVAKQAEAEAREK